MYVSGLHKCKQNYLVYFLFSSFLAGRQTLSSGMNDDDVHATRQVCRPAEKTTEK